MKNLENDLKNQLEGDINFDSITKKAYSVDASIYEIEPIGVVKPKHEKDLTSAIEIASAHQIPLIPRGAATGITGGCIGQGLIIDTSKYLNKILDINYEQEYVVCEPGVVQDQLNKVLDDKGYRLGPDTSTGNRATIGGMIGNNAAGARSLYYGRMVDHVQEIDLLLSNGKKIQFREISDAEWLSKQQQNNNEGHLYREFFRLKSEYREEIEKRFPKIPRRVSGYNLDQLLNSGPLNASRLIVGSEGTLGIFSSVKIKISKKPRSTALCILHFHDMLEGMSEIDFLLSFSPLSLEMVDRQIISMGKISPTMKGKLEWLQGDPQAIFVIELEADSEKHLRCKLKEMGDAIRNKSLGYACSFLTSKQEMDYVWSLRKAGLGLLLSRRTFSRAIAFIEDLTVAPQKLASFIANFQKCLQKHGKEAGIYGHVGSGCMHIRPFIDLRQPQELVNMKNLMEEVSDLVLEHKGALSGEHGDGLVRSWLNPKMFGEKIYSAFVELKAAFDPKNLMNPGKIVHPRAFLDHLRTSPEMKWSSIPTYLDFKAEGGFELAADLCNGNAQCRKETTLMCPSFQASKDEYDTTRARAQALRTAIHDSNPLDFLTSAGVLDVLDLCLECKGCKTECPSQIDMAKMKAEVLYQHQEKHGYSIRNRLFGHIATLQQMLFPVNNLFNWANKSSFGKAVQKSIGISEQRSLPQLASERFSRWFGRLTPFSKQRRVVLFNDTFNEFNQPTIGISAVKILHALGYQVIIPEWRCCGRPLISKGLLRQAKARAKKLMEILHPLALEGLQIVGLEPSCILTIKDDFPSLLGQDNPDVLKVTQACLTFDEFIAQAIDRDRLSLSTNGSQVPIQVHGHCHQKALVGMTSTLKVLQSISGTMVTEIESGCCGMAGSFGYEVEHYDFSLKIGELHLFPAIRQAHPHTIIVANGFSCRSQISHGTGRQAYHLAEVINQFL